MSKLFEEMMPDNVSEFLLLGGVGATSFAVIKHYATKLEEAKKSSNETIQAMKKNEDALNSKIQELKERHQQELSENTISNKAKSFLRGLA